MSLASLRRGRRSTPAVTRRAARAALSTALVAALAIAVGPAGSARAAYEPAQLLSDSAATSTEFQSATEPAISADGQWLVFAGVNEGPVGNVNQGFAGIWERNLQTGAIAPVATVPVANVTGASPPPTGPSVSAGGQFVAFTSEIDPDPVNIVLPSADFGCPEVYVRNMAIQIGQPGAFTLVAEQPLDGSPSPILFGSCGFAPSSELKPGGAQAAPGAAISADGSEVVFTVDSVSNLGQSGTSTTTPESQVAVRNLQTGVLTLVSATPQGAPTPDGGAYPSSTSVGAAGWGTESDQAKGMSQIGDVPASTAAISADGSTVAWMGTNLPAQLPGGASDVAAGMAGDPHLVNPSANDPAGQEVEPLWRRISGPDAGQTSRLLAGAGLNFYGYTGYLRSGGQAPAIQGGSVEYAEPGVPVLSANGDEVAVTADAPSAGRLAALNGYPSFEGVLHSDLYAVDMTDPAAPAVTPLTQITSDVASDGTDPSTDAVSGTIADPAISPDGTKIAFETDRTQFSLPSPSLITPPIQYTNAAQTFVVDLSHGTLQLATSTYDGLAPDGSSGFESIDDAGNVAVESTASNLIYGNVGGGSGPVPEVYLFADTPQPTAVATETLSAAPRISQVAGGGSRWALSVSASALRTGTVRLRVSVPGAGVVRALTTAQLPVGHAVSRARIPFQPIAATVRARARRQSVVRLTVALDRVRRRAAMGRDGLYAHIVVRFSAPGHPELRQTVPVTFRVRRGRRPRHHRSPRPKHRPSAAIRSAPER